MTQKELAKFFDVIEKTKKENMFWQRDLAMFHIAYYCGLRASEVGKITLADYNAQYGEIRTKRGKGSVWNTIQLDKKRKLILDRYLKNYVCKGLKQHRLYNITGEYQPIFKTKFWKPMNTRAFEIIFYKYISQTNIPQDKRHPHILKHSIAVHLADSGADIKDIKRWLGHRNVKNTEVYFQYTSYQQDQFYRRLERFNRLV